MTQDEALRALEDAEVMPCLEASLPDAKEILSLCLEAELPAVLDRADCCGASGCGCAPKVALCVRPDDVPRLREVLDGRWREMLSREGTLDEAPAGAAADGDEPPCPACGTAAPLVEGACAECGLQLG